MLEEGRQAGDRGHARRVHPLGRRGRGLHGRLSPEGRLLRVRRVAAGGAEQHLVLAVFVQVDELLAVLPPDRARVGLDRQRRYLRPREDARVGVEHRLVRLVQRFPVGVEAVGVLHAELAQADQPATRSRFVPELLLELVERHGQIAVALHLRGGQCTDRLLVRGRQHEVAVTAIGHPVEHISENLVASRLLPELHWLQGGQPQLLRARAVHLLAHQLLDVAHGPPAHRREAVEPRRQGHDEPRAQQQPVARQFRLGGRLPQRLQEVPAHPRRYGHWPTLRAPPLRSSATRAVEFGAVDEQRHGTVVHAFDLHVRAEAPSLTGRARPRDRFAEMLVQRLRPLRLRRLRERWPPSPAARSRTG